MREVRPRFREKCQRECRDASETPEDSKVVNLHDTPSAGLLSVAAESNKRRARHSLEHSLHRDDRVAIGQRVLFGGIVELLVYDHDVLGQSDAGSQKVVQAVDGAAHPVDQRKVGHRVEKRDFRLPLQQEDDRIQRRFRPGKRPRSLIHRQLRSRARLSSSNGQSSFNPLNP